MRLVDLEPRWLNEHVFIFRCPTKPQFWLSCTAVRMTMDEQKALFAEHHHCYVLPCNHAAAWEIEGRDFATISVHPSINAEPLWHGHIHKGEIFPPTRAPAYMRPGET